MTSPIRHIAGKLQILPLRAVVALAVRSGRRIQPLYSNWSRAASDHVRAVDEALSFTEAFANAAEIDETVSLQIGEAAYAAAAKAAAAARIDHDSAAQLASYAGASAHGAADTAAEAAIDPSAARISASYAIKAAINAIDEAAVAAERDYERLVDLELGHSEELGQPVDATPSGPLGPYWHGEPPSWWPGL